MRTIRTIAIDSGARRAHPGEERSAPCAHGEVRCACGSLLARIVEGAVELKCRRCKQTWRVPLAER